MDFTGLACGYQIRTCSTWAWKVLMCRPENRTGRGVVPLLFHKWHDFPRSRLWNTWNTCHTRRCSSGNLRQSSLPHLEHLEHLLREVRETDSSPPRCGLLPPVKVLFPLLGRCSGCSRCSAPLKTCHCLCFCGTPSTPRGVPGVPWHRLGPVRHPRHRVRRGRPL